MGPVTAWAGRVEILPFLPAFGYSTKLCARGHLGYVLAQRAREGHRLLPLLLQLQLMLVHGRDVVLPQLLLMLL